jgi:cytochrome c-type biogenesis protein CcmH
MNGRNQRNGVTPRIRRAQLDRLIGLGFRLSAFAFVLTLCLVATVALAQDAPVRTVTDDEVNTIAQKLYCPVCENITLDTCGTAACADWRYEIRLQLESGMTEEQIVEDFVRRFGDQVVGTPLDPTLRALALLTPWIIIALALVGAAVVFARRRAVNPPLAVASASTNRYQDLFEQDIANS